MSMHADFGYDTPGGPATPEDALQEYLAGQYPRLANAAFDTVSYDYGFVRFGYTDPKRGQMVVSVEANGDSYRIPAESICGSLDRWARVASPDE